MGMMLTFTSMDLQFLTLISLIAVIIIIIRYISVAITGMVFHEKRG